MTLKNKLRRIIEGKLTTLPRGDIVKLVNYIKSQNREIRRLAALKSTTPEIEIVDV